MWVVIVIYTSKSYKYYENGNENIMNHSHKKKIFF